MTKIIAPKSFRVKSFGCQMNVYDGERIGELLTAQGMAEVGDGADADLVVLNTCHIREKAAEKVYSDIGRIAKQSGGRARIAIAGCVAQAQGAEIIRRAPAVDLVVGPQAYHNLPDMLAQMRSGKRPIDTDMPAISKFDHLPARGIVKRASAFLTVQEGCDKFCTYCVVPYTRGAEISRPFADIVAEAHTLVDHGAREITLLGQNVNAWTGADGAGRMCGLDGLIRTLADIDGLLRIRYTTSHPKDMTDALIAVHADVPKLMPYLHLPVQSGSDAILKAMNRSHTADAYLRLIERVRADRPDIAVSGDFIVGFPGESDADFAMTLDLVDAVGYAAAYSFKYSPRPGTPAADMAAQIPAEVMDDRLARLQARINATSQAFNNSCVGKSCDILIERAGKFAGQMLGKSPWLQLVYIDAPDAAVGDLVRVGLIEAGPGSIAGALHTKTVERMLT